MALLLLTWAGALRRDPCSAGEEEAEAEQERRRPERTAAADHMTRQGKG